MFSEFGQRSRPAPGPDGGVAACYRNAVFMAYNLARAVFPLTGIALNCRNGLIDRRLGLLDAGAAIKAVSRQIALASGIILSAIAT